MEKILQQIGVPVVFDPRCHCLSTVKTLGWLLLYLRDCCTHILEQVVMLFVSKSNPKPRKQKKFPFNWIFIFPQQQNPKLWPDAKGRVKCLRKWFPTKTELSVLPKQMKETIESLLLRTENGTMHARTLSSSAKTALIASILLVSLKAEWSNVLTFWRSSLERGRGEISACWSLLSKMTNKRSNFFFFFGKNPAIFLSKNVS